MLECWKIGIMGFGILDFWVKANRCLEDKNKNR
jgi:hypothetical protein